MLYVLDPGHVLNEQIIRHDSRDLSLEICVLDSSIRNFLMREKCHREVFADVCSFGDLKCKC